MTRSSRELLAALLALAQEYDPALASEARESIKLPGPEPDTYKLAQALSIHDWMHEKAAEGRDLEKWILPRAVQRGGYDMNHWRRNFNNFHGNKRARDAYKQRSNKVSLLEN
jgi:hypothetical protein